MGNRSVSVAAVFVAVSLTTAFSQQQAEPFGAAMVRAERLGAVGKWDAAREEILSLLRRTEHRYYAIARCAEIEAFLRGCRFWLQNKDLASKRSSNAPSLLMPVFTGRIHTRYTPKEIVALHTFCDSVPFAGPFSVEIRGCVRHMPEVEFHRTVDDQYVISFGTAEKPVNESEWVFKEPPKIVHHGRAGSTVVAENLNARVPATGEMLAFRVSIQDTRLCAYVNDTLVVSARKAEPGFGRCIVKPPPSFDSVMLDGKVELLRLRDQLDASLRERIAKFEASHRPATVLPDWLCPYVEAATDRWLRAFPCQLTSAQKEAVQPALDLIRECNADACEYYLSQLPPEALPAGIRSYLRACCRLGSGNLAEAASSCDRVNELHPRFALGWRLRIEIDYQSGDHRKALAAARSRAKEFPEELSLQTAVALFLCRAGRPAAAKTVLDESLERCGASAELNHCIGIVTRALEGPAWKPASGYSSVHYAIQSEADGAGCKETARILEHANRCYRSVLKGVAKDRKKLRVFVFTDALAFRGYAAGCEEDARGDSPAFYSRTFRQLLVAKPVDRDEWTRALRHEGFRQFLHRQLAAAPPWFEQGLAQYFRTAEYVKSRPQMGRVTKEQIEALRKARAQGLLPLDRFLVQPAKSFHDRGRTSRTQSWAFVHFLRHGPRPYHDFLSKLFQELRGDASWRTSLGKVLRKHDVTGMDREFKKYVATLGKG